MSFLLCNEFPYKWVFITPQAAYNFRKIKNCLFSNRLDFYFWSCLVLASCLLDIHIFCRGMLFGIGSLFICGFAYCASPSAGFKYLWSF